MPILSQFEDGGCGWQNAHDRRCRHRAAFATDSIFPIPGLEKTTRQYKAYKGLKKESLRDNMANVELVLNMLEEVTTTDISRETEQGTGKEAVLPVNAKNLKGRATSFKIKR